MQFTGKTVEEAVETGLKELGLTEEEVNVTVVSEPAKGLFGRVKGNAVVEIEKKEVKSEAENARIFVDKVLEFLQINAKSTLDESGENPVITVIAENSADVIGYRGEVLDSLQTLAGAVANIGKKTYKKVVVDCENYRGKREDTLVSLAHRLEAKATEMKRDVILEPMPPYERRIIHTALSESETVTTKSEGKEPNRYVVIVPNDRDEFARPYNAGRNNDKHHGGKRDFGKGGKKGFKGGDKKRQSGFTEQKRAKPSGFGTYLGNSLKDNK